VKLDDLAVRLPMDIWEVSAEDRINRLRDVFQVYLNHEDSDFPFELFTRKGCVIDRQRDIGVELISTSANRCILTVILATSFHTKSSTGASTDQLDLVFQIDIDSSRVNVLP